MTNSADFLPCSNALLLGPGFCSYISMSTRFWHFLGFHNWKTYLKFFTYIWQCSCWLFWVKWGHDAIYFVFLPIVWRLWCCFQSVYFSAIVSNTFGSKADNLWNTLAPSTWLYDHINKSDFVFFKTVEWCFTIFFLSSFEINGNIGNLTSWVRQIGCYSGFSFTLCHLTWTQ